MTKDIAIMIAKNVTSKKNLGKVMRIESDMINTNMILMQMKNIIGNRKKIKGNMRMIIVVLKRRTQIENMKRTIIKGIMNSIIVSIIAQMKIMRKNITNKIIGILNNQRKEIDMMGKMAMDIMRTDVKRSGIRGKIRNQKMNHLTQEGSIFILVLLSS